MPRNDHQLRASVTPNYAYDQIQYSGLVIPNTAPAHLALCSLWHRGPTPPLERFRLAELGCGNGSNLLPLAFYNPEADFIGIDIWAHGLDSARDHARKLRLTNVQFVKQDVRERNPSTVECDYIVAHGLYSWVPQDAREAILSFCAQRLKTSGLAYISYNAQPGWATRRLVRETLLRSRSVREAVIEQKTARAKELAAQLLVDLPHGYASSILLADELQRVQSGKSSYVFHEYLAEVNDGFWLRDFLQNASDHGLQYVADAQFCRWEGAVSKHLMSDFANRDLDMIEQEELADLLCHRYFRASILSRADTAPASHTHQEILEKVQVAASLSAQSNPLDFSDGRVERFSGAGGMQVTLDSSITKAAVTLLSARWPLGLTFNQLYREASDFLKRNSWGVTECPRIRLSEELITLFEAGQVDIRLGRPDYLVAVRDEPLAHPLARFEAEYRDALTTPYHVPVSFEPPVLELVRALDGSRSAGDLRRVFGRSLVDSALNHLAKWGLLEQ